MTPIDIFVRTMAVQDEVRQAMKYLCTVRWLMEGVQITELEDMDIRAGRLYAEQNAKSDPYIITDDDVLIMGKNWIERATSVLLSHPEYAIASTLSMIEGENMAKPPRLFGPDDHGVDIYEMHSVGAPMIIRKGTCRELPPLTLDNECGEIHRMVLDMGKKEGLITGIRHMHVGNGFSSNPILRWAY